MNRRLESANSRGQDAVARGFSSAQRALALALSGLCAEGILALESLSARLGKEGLWFCFGDLFVAQCRELCRAWTHDGVGRGDVLLRRLLGNSGLQHLPMVLHALDVLSERLSIGHGDIDVPFTEDSIAGHFFFFFRRVGRS